MDRGTEQSISQQNEAVSNSLPHNLTDGELENALVAAIHHQARQREAGQETVETSHSQQLIEKLGHEMLRRHGLHDSDNTEASH